MPLSKKIPAADIFNFAAKYLANHGDPIKILGANPLGFAQSSCWANFIRFERRDPFSGTLGPLADVGGAQGLWAAFRQEGRVFGRRSDQKTLLRAVQLQIWMPQPSSVQVPVSRPGCPNGHWGALRWRGKVTPVDIWSPWRKSALRGVSLRPRPGLSPLKKVPLAELSLKDTGGACLTLRTHRGGLPNPKDTGGACLTLRTQGGPA